VRHDDGRRLSLLPIWHKVPAAEGHAILSSELDILAHDPRISLSAASAGQAGPTSARGVQILQQGCARHERLSRALDAGER
jgi:hypothetical protein